MLVSAIDRRVAADSPVDLARSIRILEDLRVGAVSLPSPLNRRCRFIAACHGPNPVGKSRHGELQKAGLLHWRIEEAKTTLSATGS